MLTKNEADETKQNLRRRLFASGKLPDASNYFLKCPICDGRGRICEEYLDDDGVASAALMTCPRCGGDGFIENLVSKQPKREEK